MLKRVKANLLLMISRLTIGISDVYFMGDKKLKKYISGFSITLFVLSLTQKSYCTTTQCSDSILVFLLGWAAIVSGAGLSWIANFLLFASWILLKKNVKTSMFLSVFATLFSLSFSLLDSISDNEGGIRHEIISYKAGYWLWISSSFFMLLGTFVLMLRHNTKTLANKRLS